MDINGVYINEQLVRYYLLRQVSVNNKILQNMINSACKSERVKYYNETFTSVLDIFAGNRMDRMYNTSSWDNLSVYDTKNRELLRIYEDIRLKHKGFRPYQYFDIDTLSAYYVYTRQLLANIRAGKSGSVTTTIFHSDIKQGLDTTMKWLYSQRVKSEENGYYNILAPIRAFRDEKKCLMPCKTPSDEQMGQSQMFERCQAEYRKYLKAKAGKTNSTYSSNLSGDDPRQIHLDI